jgi:hypothetical protein
MRWPLFFPFLLVVSCQEPAPVQEPAAAAPPAAQVDEKALLVKLAPWLTRKDDASRFSEKRCDGVKPSTLVIRVEDHRYEKKTILPLSVTRHLTWPDAAALEDSIVREHRALPANVVPEVEALAAAEYVGVFHVIQYSAPNRIFRMGRIKPEWVAGILTAWFAVHDAKTGAIRCSTHMIVRNDVSQAPLSRKLKAETTEALTESLGRELRARAPDALKRMTGALAMPESEPQGGVAAL